MRNLIASALMIFGIVGGIVGKYGTIISIIGWVLGFLSVIPAISFGCVVLFIVTFISSIVAASAGVTLLRGYP